MATTDAVINVERAIREQSQILREMQSALVRIVYLLEKNDTNS